MRTKTFWVKLALTVLMLLFIWGNSMLPAELSGRESGFVLQLIEPLVAALGRLLARWGILYPMDFLVRKMAHFAEFAVLGVLMLALFTKPGIRFSLPAPAALCLGAALLDEGIQILSDGRGPALRDVLLDFSGACLGIAAAALILCLARALRRI